MGSTLFSYLTVKDGIIWNNKFQALLFIKKYLQSEKLNSTLDMTKWILVFHKLPVEFTLTVELTFTLLLWNLLFHLYNLPDICFPFS